MTQGKDCLDSKWDMGTRLCPSSATGHQSLYLGKGKRRYTCPGRTKPESVMAWPFWALLK